MLNEIAISELCEKLNITSRTLRYYEERGLIRSIRKGDGNYRFYDFNMIKRIKQILTLRKLSFSLKDIEAILTCQTVDNLIFIFNKQLSTLKDDVLNYRLLINNLEEIIQILKTNKQNNFLDLLQLDDYNQSIKYNLKEENIRFIRLYPMRVAFCKIISKSPEKEAWNLLNKWLKKNNLINKFHTRYFGFNNPDPTPNSDVYGYEVWATVNPEIKASDGIEIKTFPGGLYAVMTSDIIDISNNWQKLYELIRNSQDYQLGNRWLEEHLILDEDSWNSNFQVDLYCPIKTKEE